jgi:manganese/zinc/iron transport system permease protein
MYSVVVGCCSSVIGYYVARWLDASIAGCMISVAGGMFLLALLFSPKHGVLFRKWKQKRMIHEQSDISAA